MGNLISSFRSISSQCDCDRELDLTLKLRMRLNGFSLGTILEHADIWLGKRRRTEQNLTFEKLGPRVQPKETDYALEAD